MACCKPQNPDWELSRPSPPAAVLVGYMGAGKTSVGRLISRELDWEFVDLDERIEARERCAVADIFRDRGEQQFRIIESDVLNCVLHEVSAGLRAIIALGGGAYVRKDNADSIRATGIPVVFLDARVEELRRRCVPQGQLRPLFTDELRFRQLYEERRGAYMQANVIIDTTARPVKAVADEIISILGLRQK